MLTRREVVKALGIFPACIFGQNALAASGATANIRLPLEEFAESHDLMTGLRKAVREMKKRKPSDRLSWFFQAAIHGVSDSLLAEAEAEDPGVGRVFQKRYWNQCPHFGDNSANFLPWHRAYTYHVEKIVRLHSELDAFALPYWNYNDLSKPENRKFPREFGIEHLDGDPGNNASENINPLFIPERSFYFAGYEHPFTDALPLLALTQQAVDATRALAAPVFFGETESEGLGGGVADENPGTRGLLEASPHDQVHRAVGGVIGATTGDPGVGYMATPPTAAFDPIFPIHHTNIDRLWAQWSCLPDKSWGRLPTQYWFDERPWFFIEEDGSTANRARKEYFDYRSLGVRFADEDLSCTPLELPASFSSEASQRVASITTLERIEKKFGVVSQGETAAEIPRVATSKIKGLIGQMNASTNDGKRSRRAVLQLYDVRLGLTEGTGFDVFVTMANNDKALNRSAEEFIGSISLFSHVNATDEHRSPVFQRGFVQSFDFSNALVKLRAENFEELKVVIRPFALFEVPGTNSIMIEREMLTVGGIKVLAVDLE